MIYYILYIYIVILHFYPLNVHVAWLQIIPCWWFNQQQEKETKEELSKIAAKAQKARWEDADLETLVGDDTGKQI